MISIGAASELRIQAVDARPICVSEIVALLRQIQSAGSIASAAQHAGLSYRYAWGLLRDVENRLGGALIEKSRGRGSKLTLLGERLIAAENSRIERLGPLLQALAADVENDLQHVLASAHGAVRLLASHGYAVAALAEALRARGSELDLRYRESIGAVDAFSRGDCEMAGFHLPIGEFRAACARSYRPLLDDSRHLLIHLTRRKQGLYLPPGNPAGLTGLHDLARTDLRFVNRQPGSGTRLVFELALRRAGVEPLHLNGYASTELTHSGLAATVASGMADVSFGVEPAARRFGLDFIPIVDEDYFFACERRQLETPRLALILEVLRSREFRAQVNQLAGYDARDCGKLCSVSEGLNGLADASPIT